MRGVTDHSRWAQLALGFWPSRALLAAAEVGVLDRLPASAEQLATDLGLLLGPTGDLLDALVGLRVVARTGDRYELADDWPGPAFTTELRDMAASFRRWGALDEALRGSHAAGLFDAVLDDPTRLRAFAEVMGSTSAPLHEAIVTAVDWSDVTTVSDLGGADGRLAAALAAAHPHLTCRTVDLPPWAALVSAPGVEVVSADVFADDLPPSDAVVLSHVLVDWDDAHRAALLAKASAMVPPGGLVVIGDRMEEPVRGRSAFDALQALDLLLAHGEAHPYTRADLDVLLAAAGFERSTVVATVGDRTVVTARSLP